MLATMAAPASPAGAPEERFNRLYQDAQTRQARRALAKKQQEEEHAQTTGRPKITPRAQHVRKEEGAAAERLYEEARKMDERKARLVGGCEGPVKAGRASGPMATCVRTD